MRIDPPCPPGFGKLSRCIPPDSPPLRISRVCERIEPSGLRRANPRDLSPPYPLLPGRTRRPAGWPRTQVQCGQCTRSAAVRGDTWCEHLRSALPLPVKQVRKVRKCGNPAFMRVCGRSAVREAVREVRKAWRLTVRLAPPAAGRQAPGVSTACTGSTARASLAGSSRPAQRESEPAAAPHPGPAVYSSRSPRIEDRTRYTVHFSAPGGEARQPKCLPSVCRCPRSFSRRRAARSL